MKPSEVSNRALKVLLSGASGLIGSALDPLLKSAGHEVWKLVRREADAARHEITWDPVNGGVHSAELEGFDSIVHLGGANIAGQRWSRRYKRELMESRTVPTAFLAKCISALSAPPRSFICASAIGFYGNRNGELLDEDSEGGSGFLPDIGRAWEEAAQSVSRPSVRTAQLRFGIVLSPRGGALEKMLLPFRAGVGGTVGNGRQYMSWISIDDAVGAIHFAIMNEKVQGAVNVVAPEAVTNREFTKTLGAVLKRPTVIPVPAFMLKAIFGEMGETLLLGSTRVRPKKLEELGYRFLFPELEAALRICCE